MYTFLAIIVFIVILGVLVLVHEFGHFMVAKKSGMVVEEFGFGFPPRLWSKRVGGTTYSLNLIPIGGFVKILGENNEGASNPNSFINKSFGARFATLVAGVLMNFILAWVLFAIGFGIGLPTVVALGDQLPAHAVLRAPQTTVLQISPGSPADKAGIKEGDSIVAVDHQQFGEISQIVAYVKSRAGNNIDLQLKRGNQALEVQAYVRSNAPADQGALGVALGTVGRLSFPWYLTPVVGIKAAYQAISETAVGFWQLIFEHQGLSNLGGPVKIATLTGQVTQLGLVYVLQFAAFLSVNLGILNIIPFPALDGGRVLFLVIEKVRGKRNNEKIEQIFNTVGFALLMLLVLLISIHDVSGLIK